MKVVTINCPNCNASIKNHTGGKKFYCEYCGSAVVLEEEATKVKHIIEGQITEEQEFINAETFLNKVKDYETSYSHVANIVDCFCVFIYLGRMFNQATP